MYAATTGENTMIYEKVMMYLTVLSPTKLFLIIQRCKDLVFKRMEKLKPIDKMVTETPDELNKIYRRFEVDGEHFCPICKSLLKGGDCQK